MRGVYVEVMRVAEGVVLLVNVDLLAGQAALDCRLLLVDLGDQLFGLDFESLEKLSSSVEYLREYLVLLAVEELLQALRRGLYDALSDLLVFRVRAFLLDHLVEVRPSELVDFLSHSDHPVRCFGLLLELVEQLVQRAVEHFFQFFFIAGTGFVGIQDDEDVLQERPDEFFPLVEPETGMAELCELLESGDVVDVAFDSLVQLCVSLAGPETVNCGELVEQVLVEAAAEGGVEPESVEL